MTDYSLPVKDFGICIKSNVKIPFLEGFEGEGTFGEPLELTVNESNASFGIERISADTDILRDSVYGDMVRVNEDYSKVSLYNTENKNPNWGALLAAVVSRLSFEDTVFCHASLVDYKGKGIVFFGPGGIGKTTQAKLWAEYAGADIINGDKVFISAKNGKVLCHGSPWHGSSPYKLNRTVEPALFVALAQSKETKITPLDDLGKLQKIVPHIFQPQWDEKCMAAYLETTDKIFSSSVKMLFMEATKDETAVNRLKEWL